jgi:hypothetical protein
MKGEKIIECDNENGWGKGWCVIENDCKCQKKLRLDVCLWGKKKRKEMDDS